MPRNESNSDRDSAPASPSPASPSPASPSPALSAAAATFDPTQITRPERALLKYYMITALLTGPGFPLVFLPLFFKYETLRYKFDSEGVSMSWGLLFRREVYLTYRRIQDIHLTGNLIQRWLGLANVSVQTASGSAMPEMVIEGLSQANELRDFLYSRMRGADQAREGHAGTGRRTSSGVSSASNHMSPPHAAASRDADDVSIEASDLGDAEVTALLTDIRDCLRSWSGRASTEEVSLGQASAGDLPVEPVRRGVGE